MSSNNEKDKRLISIRNSELPIGHKDRTYKGRVVFVGSDVRDQNTEVALFQELSSSPATMQASKAARTYCLCEGSAVKQADAKQAYAQSRQGNSSMDFPPARRMA
eukprot:8288194-Pyramimonas_sp.AAC.1